MSSIPERMRTRKSPDERRDEIAAAAVALALEQGLIAVTLRGIAARIGVASGLVAHYAPSMDDLVAATFSSIVAAELDDVRALVSAEPDPVCRITRLIDTLLDGARDDVTLVWVQGWASDRAASRSPRLCAQRWMRGSRSSETWSLRVPRRASFA